MFRLARAVLLAAALAGTGVAIQHTFTAVAPHRSPHTTHPVAVRVENVPKLPGVGRAMSAAIPSDARQVVLVTGRGPNASRDTVSLWTKDRSNWHKVTGNIAGHNGVAGWTAHHRAGDQRTPIGVFTLSEAGGALANPGTRLPYQHNAAYYSHSMYLGNEPSNVFDYLVAINFNRRADAPPSDPVEPLGAGVGGGIWLHVDDGKATAGCVSIPRSDMVRLLRWLSPAEDPVIVMGSRTSLAG